MMLLGVFLLTIYAVSGQDYTGGASQAYARSGNDYYGDNSQAFRGAQSAQDNTGGASQAFARSGKDYYVDNSQASRGSQSGSSTGAVAAARSSQDNTGGAAQAFARSEQDYNSGGSQAYARSGNDYYGDNSQASRGAQSGSSTGGVASARSRTYDVSQQQRRPHVHTRRRPTRVPVMPTTPKGAGTTLNDKNPVGGSATNILTCTLDNIKGLSGGMEAGLLEVMEIFMHNPPDKAVMMVLNTSLSNLSKNDMKDLKAGLSNGMQDMYQTIKLGGAM